MQLRQASFSLGHGMNSLDMALHIPVLGEAGIALGAFEGSLSFVYLQIREAN